MNKKIIAISATSGCGKTTCVYSLATYLKKKGKNVVVLNELARECPFEINQTAEDRTQLWLVYKQMCRELELMDRYDYVISDRSVFDPIAYAKTIGDDNWISCKYIDHLTAYAREYYSYLFLLNPEAFNYNVEDGVRDTNNAFRLQVHENLKKVFRDAKYPYMQVYDEESIFSFF